MAIAVSPATQTFAWVMPGYRAELYDLYTYAHDYDETRYPLFSIIINHSACTPMLIFILLQH